jgi:hypothetical protein
MNFVPVNTVTGGGLLVNFDHVRIIGRGHTGKKACTVLHFAENIPMLEVKETNLQILAMLSNNEPCKQ